MNAGQQAPLISVVMPSFNQAQFIDASIASVLNQSYSRIELIVADGGSTDGTQSALARWQAADRRVRWISQPDQGPADALNKALDLARGTFFGWLNSDDLYTAGAVARALEKLTDTSGNLMVYGHGEHVDAGGRFLHTYPTSPPEVGMARFANGCFICQPTVFFRRSMWVLLGAMDVSLETAFDFDYWLRAFRAFPERIGFVDAVQAQSRLHEATITHKMRRSVALEGARLLHRHLGYAPLHWILTHMAEARALRLPNLAAYLDALIEDARGYYSAADIRALHAGAARSLAAAATGSL